MRAEAASPDRAGRWRYRSVIGRFVALPHEQPKHMSPAGRDDRKPRRSPGRTGPGEHRPRSWPARSRQPDEGSGVNVIEAGALGERFGGTGGLRGGTLALPAGHVAALVGTNGARQTPPLKLAVGLTHPSPGPGAVL